MKTKDITRIPLFAALISVSAWLTVPTAPPITMQTFGVLFSVLMLGGKKGFGAVLLYIMLGVLGLPVFSGGGGGISVLFGPTGGYIFGFLLSAAFMWIAERVFKTDKNKLGYISVMSVAVTLMYAVGTLWYTVLFSDGKSTLGAILITNVLPFIIPDTVKIFLAYYLSKRLCRHLK